jgi:hypothetical protein
MAFDKPTRNALSRMVADCRRLLTNDVREQLQATYGIQQDGAVLAVDKLAHLDDRGLEIATALREWLEHLCASEAGTEEQRRKNAFFRMAQETAFTYLNRLAALRMCEERGLVIECVRRGTESDGFALYDRLTGQALGDRGQTYRIFLECMFDELAVDLGVLFDRCVPHSLVFPTPACIAEVLQRLNNKDLALLWKEDETIGWIYQDFNDEKERRQMRDVSPAPRNTRELAVRNQFFTPRYVVEFLTDNTLGRIWYEMQQGETSLKDECHYMVCHPNEIFLDPNEQPSETEFATEDLSQEEILKRPIHILYRAKKDPRDLKILDPACGSGHFLLYAFDLLEHLYIEAWQDEDEPTCKITGTTLHADYESEASLRNDVPSLILRYNLHGIDIDPRACQIAALALWLRAQRSFQRLGLKTVDRPTISKSNIVCAEPMPGEEDLRAEFIATVQPPLLSQLVERVFETMKLAGEAGSLLKVDEDISESLTNARREWAKQFARAKDEKGRDMLFSVAEMDRLSGDAQQRLDFSDITNDQFWDEAEGRVVTALQHYAEQSTNGHAIQRGLFREDAAQGFAFIDVCRNRYDVILMNPPFGESPEKCDEIFDKAFPLTSNDLYGMFYERTLQWLTNGGKVGAITNRTWLGLPTFENLRSKVFCVSGAVEVAADLGSFVLEAQVETLAAVISSDATAEPPAFWVRLLKTRRKEETLVEAVEHIRLGTLHPAAFLSNATRFAGMPQGVYGYWMSNELIGLYHPKNAINPEVADVKQGTATADDFRFLRLSWEIAPNKVGIRQKWARFAKGGTYSPFFDDIHLVLNWEDDGRELAAFPRSYIRNAQFYGKPGVTWPLRTTSAFGPRALPVECTFGHKGPAAIPKTSNTAAVLLGLLTTRPTRLLMTVRLGAGDNAPGSASKSYEVGLVGSLPYPDISEDAGTHITQLTLTGIDVVRLGQFAIDETTAGFIVPPAIKYRAHSLRESASEWVRQREERLVQLANVEKELDQLVVEAFGFTPSDYQIMGEELEVPLNRLSNPDEIDDDLFRQAYLTKEELPGGRLPGGEEAAADVRIESRRKKQQTLRDEATLCRVFEITPRQFADLRHKKDLLRDDDLREVAAGTLSYLLGAVFGRWDVRQAIHVSLRPALPEPFAALPACSPGMLTGDNGLPIDKAPTDYPIEIARDGVLVDDEGLDGTRPHSSDIVRRIKDVIPLIWGNTAEDIEQEICEILRISNVRDFFRMPLQFFDFHLSRYRKSRRVAPIYWPLSTVSGSYTVWVYYHRLNDQTLYTIVNQYLEPKIDDVQHRLTYIEGQLPNTAGADATLLRDELHKLRDLLGELLDMKQELLRVAALPYKPDLNDGVIINATPLHKLFRHSVWAKDCADCWKKLEKGDYDWTHMAYNIWPDRVREACKKDCSLAIAHGLEDICEVPLPGEKKKRKSLKSKT